MPQLTYTTSVAAGATFLPLTGWQYEYLPWPALVEVGQQGTATGLVTTITVGSDTLQESSPIGAGGTAGVLPSPLNLPYLMDDAASGDRIKILVSNPTAGAITVTGIIKLTPRV